MGYKTKVEHVSEFFSDWKRKKNALPIRVQYVGDIITFDYYTDYDKKNEKHFLEILYVK